MFPNYLYLHCLGHWEEYHSHPRPESESLKTNLTYCSLLWMQVNKKTCFPEAEQSRHGPIVKGVDYGERQPGYENPIIEMVQLANNAEEKLF